MIIRTSHCFLFTSNINMSFSQRQSIHIHETKDRTIPIRNVEPTHIIEGGSHMMTLTQPSPINELILNYLNQ